MKRVLLSLFFIISSSISFAYDVIVNGIYYNLIDGEAQVTNGEPTTPHNDYYEQTRGYYWGKVEIPSKITVSGVEYPVTSIGTDAFYLCSSLSSITIPESVTSIEARAFAYCTKLTTVDIPNSITSIGERAFEYCTELSTVTIPNSVTSLGGSAFYECTSLTSVTIGNSVKSIGGYTFKRCSQLNSVTIGNSVANIGVFAFSYCSSLTSIIIPNSVTDIDMYAFSGCSGLTSITIGNSVTNIGYGAFNACYIPKDNFINNSALKADEYGYWGAKLYDYITTDGLIIGDNTVILAKDNTKKTYNIPNSVTCIGEDAFHSCCNLTSIIIPNSVTDIGSAAFENCSALTSLTLGSSVKTFGQYAFSFCPNVKELIYAEGTKTVLGTGLTSITSVTISSSVEEISKDAFYNCHNLEDVICLATTPPTCQPYVFRVSTGNPYEEFDVYNFATLHVPSGCKEAYSLADDWKNFKNIKEEAPSENGSGNTYETITLEINQCAGGYVKVNMVKGKSHTIQISPEGMNSINTVLFNGQNVTNEVNNGYYTTPILNESSRLVVSYEIFNTKAKNLNAGNASNISVYGIDNTLHIKGVNTTTSLRIYDTNGTMIESSTISGDTNLPLPDGIFIVKIGQRTFKVAM